MADSDAVALAGRWWRQVPHGRDPLARPEPPKDGRWQRGEIVDALYLADSEETALAEWYRFIAELALPPDRALPIDLWKIEVALERVADLTSAESLSAAGLSLPSPTRRGWPAYQRVGERLAAEGFDAVLAPSAAHEGGRALCVFVREGWLDHVRTVGRPRSHDAAPAPPRGLRT